MHLKFKTAFRKNCLKQSQFTIYEHSHPLKILVLTAFPREASDFLEALRAKGSLIPHPVQGVGTCLRQALVEDDIFFAHTGLGTEDTAISVTALLLQIEPDVVLMCGTAGGTNPEFKVGDLVIGTEVIHIDLHSIHEVLRDTPFAECLVNPNTSVALEVSWPADSSLLELCRNVSLPGIHLSKIFTSNTFPSPHHVFELITSLGGGAIEMESSGVCRAVQRLGGIPAISVRAISNLLDEKGADRGTPAGGMEMCSKKLSDFLMAALSQILENKKYFASAVDTETAELIRRHDLAAHPEGGFYRQTHRSTNKVGVGDRMRAAGTSILFLLRKGDYSAWHTVDADETWYFHEGSPLEISVIDPSTNALQTIRLGGPDGLLQYTVPRGHIFAAESSGDYSLTGCAVSPGFEFSGFRLTLRAEIATRLSENIPQLERAMRLVRDVPVESAVATAAGFSTDFRGHHRV